MPDQRVRLMHYDPRWRQEFEQTRSSILHSCAGWVTAVEHIGSTAISGLIARPTIDVIASVADDEGHGTGGVVDRRAELSPREHRRRGRPRRRCWSNRDMRLPDNPTPPIASCSSSDNRRFGIASFACEIGCERNPRRRSGSRKRRSLAGVAVKATWQAIRPTRHCSSLIWRTKSMPRKGRSEPISAVAQSARATTDGYNRGCGSF